MKYGFTKTENFTVDIDFDQIYNYIVDTESITDDYEIYNDFMNNIYEYILKLYGKDVECTEDNTYVTDMICDDWYTWLVENKNFDA